MKQLLEAQRIAAYEEKQTRALARKREKTRAQAIAKQQQGVQQQNEKAFRKAEARNVQRQIAEEAKRAAAELKEGQEVVETVRRVESYREIKA